MQKPKQLIFDFYLNRKASLQHFYFNSQRLAFLFNLKNFSRFPKEFLVMGGAGSGKSYLTQAYLNDASSMGIKSGFIPLQAIIETSITSLEGYENFELVVIDGLENLSQRKTWQTIIFNFLNHAHQTNCKTILTASRALSELDFFPDLHSRITRMEMESLMELQHDQLFDAITFVSESYDISISDKEVEYLLTRYHRDMGSIMNAIHSLDKLSASQKRKITVPLVKEFLDS